MIEKTISIKYEKKLKFENEFSKCKKVVIFHEGKINTVRNYKEFLEQFSFDSDNSINELEKFFISFIKCIAIMKDIEIRAVYNNDKIIKEPTNKIVKNLYMNNLQSIINIIVELNIANILVVY